MRDLAGQTAFVTGAASGIGLGIATALSQAGVKVMLCDTEEEAPKKAVADLKARTSVDADGVKADVSLKGELQAAADATVGRYGGEAEVGPPSRSTRTAPQPGLSPAATCAS